MIIIIRRIIIRMIIIVMMVIKMFEKWQLLLYKKLETIIINNFVFFGF